MTTDPGNNSESEYFAGLFGQPELTRRANWDGREEPIVSPARPDNALNWTTRKARHRPGQPPFITIDINHEVVD